LIQKNQTGLIAKEIPLFLIIKSDKHHCLSVVFVRVIGNAPHSIFKPITRQQWCGKEFKENPLFGIRDKLL